MGAMDMDRLGGYMTERNIKKDTWTGGRASSMESKTYTRTDRAK